jgi:hypothetical protein
MAQIGIVVEPAIDLRRSLLYAPVTIHYPRNTDIAPTTRFVGWNDANCQEFAILIIGSTQSGGLPRAAVDLKIWALSL